MRTGLLNKMYLILCLLGPLEFAHASCNVEKSILFKEFFLLDFEKGRSTVGEDQVLPLKEKVLAFVRENPDVVVESVSVLAISPKVPFYSTVKGRRMVDSKSSEKNFSLANQRAYFAQKVFSEEKKTNASLSQIKFKIGAKVSGPEFEPLDLNDRFVTSMTKGYLKRIETLYKNHKTLFEESAIQSRDLLDEKRFPNLFQAKFKPFHGFRMTISGYKKQDPRCLDEERTIQDKASSSKQ